MLFLSLHTIISILTTIVIHTIIINNAREVKMYNVLVVDDRTEMLEVIERFLDQKGFVVYLSNTEEKALRLCKVIKFDLVISDFELEEASGVDLLNKIKKKQYRIKTILMSGSFKPDEERIEIDAFLQKPFESAELESAIRKVLNK